MCDEKESEGRAAPASGPEAVTRGEVGAMNAYDIPRYNAQGYVQGRPTTPNDPLSAGKVHGGFAPAAGPAGHPGNAAPPQGMMGAGVNLGYGPVLGGAPLGYPGGPQPPAMAYGSAGPAYVQMPAGPPMGYYGGQMPPPGMVYGAGAPVYGQMPPAGYYYGSPLPPPGMVYGQAPPEAAAVHPGTPGQGAGGSGNAHGPARAEGADANAQERIAAVVREMANGQPPDVDKMVALFNGFDTQFWKGALIGAVVAVLVSSETVRSGVAGAVGGLFARFKGDGGPKGSAPDPT